MLKEVYGIIALLIIAIPVGFLLAYLTKDEASKGRRFYSLISGFSFLLTIIWPFFNVDKEYSSVIMMSLFFTGIVFFIMVLSSLTKRGEGKREVLRSLFFS